METNSSLPLFTGRCVRRRVVRLLAASVIATFGLVFGGCSTATPVRRLEVLSGTTPAPILVAAGRELTAAEAHAERDGACFTLIGSGRSMEPLYADGTAIVVREQSFLTLRAGMAVVYRNQDGQCVAHLLVEEMHGGWVATGLNNREPDDEFVTRENLVGVITAAYASAAPSSRAGTAAQIALHDGIDRSLRTASLR